LSGKKRRLAWLRPPVFGDDGKMALVDHLIELRYRFLVSIAAIIVTSAVALVFQRQLLGVVLWPINQAIAIYESSRSGAHVQMVTQGITAGFALYFQVAFTAGVIAACPVWLYQLWRFIVPALDKPQRRTAARFLAAAVPLFFLGVAAGYFICPHGFAVLIGFNPPSVTNLNDVGTFMSFELRLLLIFGLAFQLPVLLVSLNRLGLVTGAALGKFRNVAIVLAAIFAAIATPTTDALTMLAIMVPIVAGYLVAEIICRRHDRHALAAAQPA